MEPWIVAVGLNALMVVFGFGAAYMRLKANSEKISDCQTDMASMEDRLWKRVDGINAREGRHYRNILVALTALSVGGNPKSPIDVIRKMTEEDDK